MKLRWYFFLFLAGLGAVSSVAVFQRAPGYMDADYYYAVGLRLATGAGFSEPFLWNYLDDPAGLPHPSNAYWMPLASLLAAAGMKLSGMVDFNGARLGFLLVAALIPPVTAGLSYSLTARRDYAIFSGLLAAVPVFYLSYQGTTDNFGIYMLLGGLWFLAAGDRFQVSRLKVGSLKSFNLPTFNLQPFLLGLLAGLMHLARADGVLWLFISIAAVGLEIRDWRLEISQNSTASKISNLESLIFILYSLISILLGYLVIMGPWMARNLTVFGTLLSPGGGRALWLTSYDELYAFPASMLTPAHWWSVGLGEVLRARASALGQNLLSAFAVQGGIFLSPLILLGAWRLRCDRRVQLGAFAWLATLLSMTVVFPHQGWRGGFFHSGAALQPIFWAAAPVGLEVLIGWGVRVRGWQPHQAGVVFRAGCIGLTVFMAILVVPGRVIGTAAKDASSGWGESDAAYKHLEQALQSLGVAKDEIIAVNNPAGFYAATSRPAIVIPDGTEASLLAASRRYGAHYVLLEVNHPVGLNELYDKPGNRPGLHYLKSFEKTHIFRVE